MSNVRGVTLRSQAPGRLGHWLQTRSPWKRTMTLLVGHPIANTRTKPKVQPQNKDFQQNWGKVWDEGFILEKLFQRDDVVTLLSTGMCLYSLGFALYPRSVVLWNTTPIDTLLCVGAVACCSTSSRMGAIPVASLPHFPGPSSHGSSHPLMGTTGMHTL